MKEATPKPQGPLTLHVLQLQEDGVVTHEVAKQLGHVRDAVRDDGQPLPVRHGTPGQALGGGRQVSGAQTDGALRGDVLAWLWGRTDDGG